MSAMSAFALAISSGEPATITEDPITLALTAGNSCAMARATSRGCACTIFTASAVALTGGGVTGGVSTEAMIALICNKSWGFAAIRIDLLGPVVMCAVG